MIHDYTNSDTIPTTGNPVEYTRNWLGRRMLLQVRRNRHDTVSPVHAREYTVIEISPSGNFVKLRDDFGKRFWAQAGALVHFETLAEKMRKTGEDRP